MTMNTKLFLAPAALLLASAAQPEPPLSADLQCLFVSLELSGGDNPALVNSGVMSTLYFLGKIDAQAPGADLEAMIRKEMVRSTPEDRKAQLLRCGTQLKERGAYLQAMGKRLEQPPPA